ncbi:hypothetical protein J2800_002920 [Caulobacter rhizosphaerae]|uniref:Uncharacterized protein n=1 Tax=Caulobacter rhizosphaerae TaxID=2010972 RepID=A0ABU1N172_9CAUL|nr:hypothetical protein [Caulobacter rhizosphaerae]
MEPASKPFHLGPGIRRDERIKGVAQALVSNASPEVSPVAA